MEDLSDSELKQKAFWAEVGQGLGSLRPETLLKKRLWHRCFPVNFVKFLRTPFFIEHLRWLLLVILFEISHSNPTNYFKTAF